MKNKGLNNRFDMGRLNSIFAFHYKCLWCDKAGADCFHHIISASSPNYKEGEFNSSILNACPIHNHGCHLYNSELHKTENEKMLLNKVLNILAVADIKMNDLDREFFNTYRELYGY